MSGKELDEDQDPRGESHLGASAFQDDSLRKALSAAVGRICPSWLAQEREDLVQTALLRIVSLLGAEQPHRSVNASYLWKTAYSVTLDEIRRARWRFERGAQGASLEDSATASSPDPEASAASREICQHVRACLRSLEDSRRRAVLMRLGGYTHEEAAERLRMSLKQVANFVHRGMNDLRRCLRAKGVTA